MITAVLKAIGTALAHASIAALVAVAVIRLWPPPSQDIQLRQWATQLDTRVDANFADVQSKIAAVKGVDDQQLANLQSQLTTGQNERTNQAALIHRIDTDLSDLRYQMSRSVASNESANQLSFIQAQLTACKDQLASHAARLNAHDAMHAAAQSDLRLLGGRVQSATQPRQPLSLVYWQY